MTTAELHITSTSPTCTRYVLISDGSEVWSNRVSPTPEGHAGARSRMAAWALAHKVTVVEKQPEPAPVKQAVIQGRYGRH